MTTTERLQQCAKAQPYGKKALDWLRLCSGGIGMYPGLHTDMLPAKHLNRFHKDGLIDTFVPDNMVHKTREYCTEKGKQVLRDNGIEPYKS